MIIMNGEEVECATFIDGLEEVEYWLRNIEEKDYSFWMPTSTDKFYLDFVAQLKDAVFLLLSTRVRIDGAMMTRKKNALSAKCGKSQARADICL